MICNRREILPQSLRSVRSISNVCLLSCITNFLTSSEESSSTLSIRIDPVLPEFFSAIRSACLETPSRRYLACPPMYRRFPLWYRDGLPDVLAPFSSASRSVDRAENRTQAGCEARILPLGYAKPPHPLCIVCLKVRLIKRSCLGHF